MPRRERCPRRRSLRGVSGALPGAPQGSSAQALAVQRAREGVAPVPRRRRALCISLRNAVRTLASPRTHVRRRATADPWRAPHATRPGGSSGVYPADRWPPLYKRPALRAAHVLCCAPHDSSRASGAAWGGTRSPRCTGAHRAGYFRCRCPPVLPARASSPGSAAMHPRRPCNTGCGSSGGRVRRPG